jgi:hypothetical protein
LLLRRVWLPRWLYAVLPSIYLLLGAAALAAAAGLEHAAWILPLGLVMAAGLLHLGLWAATARYRHREARRASRSALPSPVDRLPA